MKNKRIIDKQTCTRISVYLLIQIATSIIVSFLSIFLISFVSNGNVINFNVIATSAGIILPMAFGLGIINIFSSRHLYRQTMDLSIALENAANGDFYAKLDTRYAGTMKRAYDNFNILEEQLKKTSKMQDEFVNNYSHEFKTPITSIKGFTEMILKEDLLEEEKKQYLQIILEESERLTNLANNATLYTKLNSQVIVQNKEEYYLDEQIRKCIILFEKELENKNIKLECNLEKIKYYTNYNMLQEVWINLIGNAIKYTNSNGKITIELKKNKENIEISIQDTGIGMTEEQLKHIFERYYQVDKSKNIAGLGLGLSIVQRIIELIGGKIEVQSKLGEGSKFSVFIN